MLSFPQNEPYVIAELGHNHQGSIQTCQRLMKAAKEAGCHAVKLQKRENKTLYSEEYYNSWYNSENAYGKTYGEHREALEFDEEQYKYLKAYATGILGIDFFATAFDIPSADMLLRLEMPALKLASGDIDNLGLLEHVSSTWGEVPIIFSTGGATLDAVRRAYKILNRNGRKLCILQCTSGYPASYAELDLAVIRTFQDEFPGAIVGWSGHDTGTWAAVVAAAFGARVIEKHFTLNRAWKGTDQSFSLEPQGMRTMVDNLRLVGPAIGDGIKKVWPSELEPLKKQRKNANGQIDGCH